MHVRNKEKNELKSDFLPIFEYFSKIFERQATLTKFQSIYAHKGNAYKNKRGHKVKTSDQHPSFNLIWWSSI